MAEDQTGLGHVATPAWLASDMVAAVFAERDPAATDVVIDPGCGEGIFIEAVLSYSRNRNLPIPRILGIERDATRAAAAAKRFGDVAQVAIRQTNFLKDQALPTADFIVGNPPYVSLKNISPDDRSYFRNNYSVAKGRFDLYMLFYQQALNLLKDGGMLTFVTPEKWLYVESGSKLRDLLKTFTVSKLWFCPESTFAGYTTYPLVCLISKTKRRIDVVTVTTRNGDSSSQDLATVFGEQPNPRILQFTSSTKAPVSTLLDLCSRIGCGPATGIDDAFIVDIDQLPERLQPFAHPTLAGRNLGADRQIRPTQCLLLPYDQKGKLLPEAELKPLLEWLELRRSELEARSCASRKPWYATHETPAMQHLLQPKVMCKDIAIKPEFYLDTAGTIVPRHSIYYLVPQEHVSLEELYGMLTSQSCKDFINRYAQKAANGYLRLQSSVLKRIPLSSAAAELLRVSAVSRQGGSRNRRAA